MTQHQLAPWIASCAGALLLFGVAWMLPATRLSAPDASTHSDRSKARAVLAQLEQECATNSAANDYAWSSNAPPTERRRREVIEQLQGMRDGALTEVRSLLKSSRNNEFGEMLVVLAAALGDVSKVIPAAKLMAYSDYPAVRLSAARELRKLRDPMMIEWFDYAARHDDRCVRSEGCGRSVEFYYPIRAVAELALKDMGVEFVTTEQLLRAKKVQALERIQAIIIRNTEMERQKQATPSAPPSVPAEGTPPRLK